MEVSVPAAATAVASMLVIVDIPSLGAQRNPIVSAYNTGCGGLCI